MSNQVREQIIENAIRDYKGAMTSTCKTEKRIESAINEMHNVYIMCAPHGVNGVERLRLALLSAENQ